MIGGDEEMSFCFGVDSILGGDMRYELCFDDVIVHDRGRHIFQVLVFLCFLFYLCLCSCFINYDTLVMTYIMRLFMVYVFYFMFCENNKFILVYLYFPRMHLWFGNLQVDSFEAAV